MEKPLLILITLCILLSGSAAGRWPPDMTQAGNGAVQAADALPQSMLTSYYLSPEDPVCAYLQHHSLQRFFDMWFHNFIDENSSVHWNYDTLAPVQLLDHEFHSVAKPGLALYTCTFTTGEGRCGYLIVSYDGAGPAVSKWSLQETTPYQYDLRANSRQLAAALAQTDLDLSTATATRVEWLDTEKNRGDRIILFADAKGGRYVCCLGGDDFTLERA